MMVIRVGLHFPCIVGSDSKMEGVVLVVCSTVWGHWFECTVPGFAFQQSVFCL